MNATSVWFAIVAFFATIVLIAMVDGLAVLIIDAILGLLAWIMSMIAIVAPIALGIIVLVLIGRAIVH